MTLWPFYILIAAIVALIWSNLYLLIKRLQMAKELAERREREAIAALHMRQWLDRGQSVQAP